MEENLQHHVHIINIVHDEIVLEVLDEVAERASVKLGQCMEEAGKVFIHGVPVIAKPVVSNYWIH